MKKFLAVICSVALLVLGIYLMCNQWIFTELIINHTKDSSIDPNALQIVYSNHSYGEPILYILRDGDTGVEYILIQFNNQMSIIERKKP